MAGLIFGALAGALAGGGAAGERAFDTLLRSKKQQELETLRAELMYQKQSLLQQQQQQFSEKMEDVREERAVGREMRGYAHAQAMAQQQFDFQHREHEANRELTRMQMDATRRYQNAMLGMRKAELDIQRNKVTAWADPSGAYWLVGADGKIKSAMTLPGSDEQVKGKPPVDPIVKATIEGMFTAAAKLLDSDDPRMVEQGMAAMNATIAYANSVTRSGTADAPPPEAIGRLVSGITSGKSEQDVNKLFDDFSKAYPKFATPEFMQSLRSSAAAVPGSKEGGASKAGSAETGALPSSPPPPPIPENAPAGLVEREAAAQARLERERAADEAERKAREQDIANRKSESAWLTESRAKLLTPKEAHELLLKYEDVLPSKVARALRRQL